MKRLILVLMLCAGCRSKPIASMPPPQPRNAITMLPRLAAAPVMTHPFRVMFCAPDEAFYALEVSTNLIDWTDAVVTNGAGEFTIWQTNDATMKFYRVRGWTP